MKKNFKIPGDFFRKVKKSQADAESQLQWQRFNKQKFVHSLNRFRDGTVAKNRI